MQSESHGEWSRQGFLKEVFRRRPSLPPGRDEALKETIDSLGAMLLVGEGRSSEGDRFYLVGAVLEQVSSFTDSQGITLQPFVPFQVFKSYQDALHFAQTYEEILLRGPAGGDLSEASDLTPSVSHQIFNSNCELRCFNQFNSNIAACDAAEQSCRFNADILRIACRGTCFGNPACLAGCGAVYLGALTVCALDRVACGNTAETLHFICVDNCGEGGGGGCLATATETVTTVLALRGSTALGEKLASAPVDFALSRAENRGEESFVMDEWAIAEDGRVRRSSNPAFAQAVVEQDASKALGPFLVIQEPVHDMNSRHVPKPQVRISSALAKSERGRGEVVAARLEFSPTKTVDHLEILYTSSPMDESRLEKLIRPRVAVESASEKGHRTAVYVVIRLTDRVEVLGTATAFPKCCCGGQFCV